jgi:LuxR family transcriptional regulator, maltose regulon positive regulatory protein
MESSLRGRFAPPLREFEPVLPEALESLTTMIELPKLVAVCAPPGYGKTVLLSILYEHQKALARQLAWVTLDDRDRSAHTVIALIQTALSAGTANAFSPSSNETLGDADVALSRLLEALAQLTTPTLVFVDNLHFCTDPRIGAFIDSLVFATPSAFRIVVSSTSRLPIDVTRAKLDFGARFVGEQLLSFDVDRVRKLFHTAGGTRPSEGLAERIVARTEGWPAAVRLLLVLTQSGADVEAAIEQFSGEQEDIALVLTRRILADFSSEQVGFLCELSLLRDFSVELAASITGERNAAQWITHLTDRNLLVFPLDSGRRWLRMHTLLRQFLLAEGRIRLTSQRRGIVLENAARWHATQGDYATAIDLALEVPAYSLASDYLKRSSQSLVGNQGRLLQFIGWVEPLIASGTKIDLDTHAWYIWALCFSLKYEAAQRSIESFDLRLETEHLSVTEASDFQKRLGLLRVVVSIYLDRLDIAREVAAIWLSNSSGQDALSVATVATGAAIADIAGYDYLSARASMTLASGAVERSESPYGRAWVACIQACIELAQGYPLEANRILTRNRPSALAALGAEAGVMSTIDFVQSRVMLDLGLRADAGVAAQRALQRSSQHGVTETARHGLAACISLWDGSAESIWSPSALAPIARSHGTRLVRLLDSLVVRRLVQFGRLDEARSLAERGNWERRALPSWVASEQIEVVLAHIALDAANGRAHKALASIETRLQSAKKHSMWRDVVELELMASATHARQGKERLALRHLSQAIVIAARCHLFGPFDDHRVNVERILGVYADREFGFTVHDQMAFLSQQRQLGSLLRDPSTGVHIKVGVQSLSSPSDFAPLDTLTPRELEFLEFLTQGLNNQQIADRIGLSVATVKWHLYNLYGKLAVKNRSAALAAARTMGITAR